jgi:hypothetical protein
MRVRNFRTEIKGYREVTKEEFLDLFIQLKTQTQESKLSQHRKIQTKT